jgi:hypothetical protein
LYKTLGHTQGSRSGLSLCLSVQWAVGCGGLPAFKHSVQPAWREVWLQGWSRGGTRREALPPATEDGGKRDSRGGSGRGKVCSIRIAFNFLRPAAMFSNRPAPRLSRSLVQGNFCLKAKLLNLRYFRTSLRKDQWNTRVFCVTLTCVSVINQIKTNNCDCCVLFLSALQAEWGLPDLCYLEEGSAVRSHALTSRSVCSRVALIS